MNNMNPIYQEFIVRQLCKNLEAETRQNRLAKEAAHTPAINNGWVAHRIAHFAEWMIATGETLRQHYDHTAMHTYNSRTGALAR
jgi:hypothetical protein